VAWAVLLSLAGASRPAAAADPTWRTLQAGVEYAALGAAETLHVVRIDPSRSALVAHFASAEDRRARTAAEWCRFKGLAAAINLGMYAQDGLTNVGHAHAGRHVNNPRWASQYKSALGLDPSRPSLPPALFADLDVAGARERLGAYGTVVQNLRLIRAPGRSVWAQQPRRWSEAAVAADHQGRILFVFSRHPDSMADLNQKLLALPLGIAAAMHVEGGPEASLSIHAGGIDLDLNGSFETGFNENQTQVRQWPIPNVLATPRR
jgi:Phosphodiester glycosidase